MGKKFLHKLKESTGTEKKAVRIIGNYDRRTDSTLSIFKKLNLLNIGQI